MRKLYMASLALALLFFSCNDDEPNNGGDPGGSNDSNVVTVNYDIEQPTTWSKDSIYYLPNGIYVEAALTIEAGTIIKFGPVESIDVWENGVINAVGTADEPIIFTSIKDDENGGDVNNDGDATSPAKGDWAYIDLNTSNGSKIIFCKFLYGGNNDYYGALSLGGNTSTVQNCTFAYNDAYVSGSEFTGAIFADEADPATIIKSNTFYGNKVPLSMNSHLSLDNSNTFHNPEDATETNTYNGIFIPTQDIDGNSAEWRETEIPFVVCYGSLEIWADYSLTLGNNVVLKFLSGAGLSLHNSGTLINSDGPGVVFTSFKDDSQLGDTNGDGDATSPSDNDWDGIEIDYNYMTWANIHYDSY